jgi:sulfite exporter TauE/SafE
MNVITYIAEPLALGLSTGTWCAMYCAPVLLPFLFARENQTYRRNASLVGLFLAGRLVAYAALGIILSFAGLLVLEFFDPYLARRLSTIAYMACGAVLLANVFAGRASCKANGACGSRRSRMLGIAGNDHSAALLSGLCVGFHICPAFWAAAFRAVNADTIISGAAYFALFYIGTLPFFLPLLGIPFVGKKTPSFRRIALIAQILMGIYFIVFAGLIPFLYRR